MFTLTIVNFILAIYSIFILVCRITFYKKLTKTCKCPSIGWELKYTEYYTYFLAAISVIGLFVNIILTLSRRQIGSEEDDDTEENGTSHIFVFVIMVIILIAGGIDIYCIHKIRNKLIEDECECDKQLREIIYYSTLISLIIFIFFTGIFFGIFVGVKLSGSLNISEDCIQIKQQYDLATQRLNEELKKRK